MSPAALSASHVLVRVGRPVLPDWLAAVAAGQPRVLAHVRADWHEVRFARPLPRAALFEPWLCGWALPLCFVRTLQPRGRIEPAALAEDLARACGPAAPRAVAVRALHRALLDAEAPLRAALAQRLPGAAGVLPDGDADAAADDLDRRELVVVLGSARVWAGVATRRETGSPFVAAREPHDWLEEGQRVSRAAVKWREAAALLAFHGVPGAAARHWLDLGAAPGGITDRLSRDPRVRVTAIDVAPLDPAVAQRPNVTAIQADLYTWAPETVHDGLVCDVCGDPQAARGALRLVPWLRAGSPLMLTIKLPDWDGRRAALAETLAACAAARVRVLGVHHLAANKRELTLLGVVEGR